MMVMTKTLEKTSQLIQGPAGQLELMIDLPTAPKKDMWGIICHPHPLHGGTMHNKVVTTLSKTFRGLGLKVVRFNFRGVGQSLGRFDQGQGELEDLLSVMDWLQREHQPREIWLAGFSFGGSIAARAGAQIPVQKLVLVAPSVDSFAMKSLAPILCPWILAQGEQDEVLSAADIFAWAEQRTPPPTILRFAKAGHFFHGQLIELRQELERVLR